MAQTMHKADQKATLDDFGLIELETGLAGARAMAAILSQLLDALFQERAADYHKVSNTEAENMLFAAFNVQQRLDASFSEWQDCLHRFHDARLSAQAVGHADQA